MTPEDIIWIDRSLDLEQPLVVLAPKAGLPVRFGWVVLQIAAAYS